MTQHQSAEGHLGSLAAAERLDGLEDLVAPEPENGEGGADFRLGHPRVHVVDFIEDRLRHGEVHLVLVEVPDRHAHAETDAADPFQDLLHERRLPDAVLADQEDPLSAADVEAHVLVQDLARELHGEVVHVEDLFPADAVRVEEEREVIPLILRFFEVFREAVDLLLFALRRADVPLPVPAFLLFDDAFDAVDFRHRVVIVALQAQVPLRFQSHVPVVVAVGHIELAQRDLGDAVADLVEEVPVVGDDDGRDAARLDEVLEPVHRRDVEVVRRLVEEHEVRFLQEELGKADLGLLATGKAPDRQVLFLVGEPEAGEDGPGEVLVGQSIACLIGREDLFLSRDERRVPRMLSGERLPKLFELCLHLKEMGKDPERLFVGRAVGVGANVLFQVAERGERRADDGAVVRLLCPCDEVEERRLAGAVGTDETDDIAFFDRKVRLLEEKPVAKGFGQIADV